MKLILKKEVIGTRRDTIPPRQTTYVMPGDRAQVIFNNTTGSVNDLENLEGHFICSSWRKDHEFIVFPSQITQVILEKESDIQDDDDLLPGNPRNYNNNFIIEDDSLYPEET